MLVVRTAGQLTSGVDHLCTNKQPGNTKNILVNVGDRFCLKEAMVITNAVLSVDFDSTKIRMD